MLGGKAIGAQTMAATQSSHDDNSARLSAQWRELANDETTPNRFELNERGEVVWYPLPTSRHQVIVAAVAQQVNEQLGEMALCHVSVLTAHAGVRCPDVAWLPKGQTLELLDEDPLPFVPTFVAEVLAPHDREPVIAHKIGAYLAGGATEVAVVATDGKVEFHRADGVHESSSMGVTFSLVPELFT